MSQTDTVIEMLSERRAGSKLKSITIKHSPYEEGHSVITFVFEGEGEERHVGIYGKDLKTYFGTVAVAPVMR